MKVHKQFVRGDDTVAVTAEHLDGDRWRVRVGERVHELDAVPSGDGGVRIVVRDGANERSFRAYGASCGPEFMVRADGRTHTLAAPVVRRGGGAGGGADGKVRAPMTGTVLEVLCKVGDVVTADQPLVVLSAMKMEHKLVAGIAGTVVALDAAAAGTVEQGAVLVTVAPADVPTGQTAEGKS